MPTMSAMLKSESFCRDFFRTQNGETVAKQIQHDRVLCAAQKLSSILALYIPLTGFKVGDELAIRLNPDTARYRRSVTRAQYAGTVQTIKAYLDHMTHESKGRLPTASIKQSKPPRQDFETALDVLDLSMESQDIDRINLRTSFENVVRALRKHLSR
jgi:hypothetical protein